MGYNSKLYSYGMTDSNMCGVCDQGEEKYEHLFIKCGKVNQFGLLFKQWITQNTHILPHNRHYTWFTS